VVNNGRFVSNVSFSEPIKPQIEYSNLKLSEEGEVEYIICDGEFLQEGRELQLINTSKGNTARKDSSTVKAPFTEKPKEFSI